MHDSFVSRFSWTVVGLSVALGTVLLTNEAHADTLVGPAKATNVEPGEAAALEQLFVDAYSVKAKERLLVTRENNDSPPLSDPMAEAQRLGASEYVVLSFVGLGKNIQIRASRHQTADGQVVHSVKTTASSVEEASKVMDRIAQALHEKKTFEDTQKIGNTTTEESSGIENVVGIRAGGFFVWGDDVDYQPYLSFGFNGKLELDFYFIEYGAGFSVPLSQSTSSALDVGGIYTELGASFYLTQTEIAPYLGGGLMPRIWFTEGANTQDGANLATYGQLGVMFMRSRSTRFYADYRVAVNLSPIDGFHPIEHGIEVGVGW